jgi:hypothetical protein
VPHNLERVKPKSFVFANCLLGAVMNIADKMYLKYDNFSQPVVIISPDLNILYKNSAAKIVNMKPRVGANIKKYIDYDNSKKLCFSIKNKSPNIIKLNIPTKINRCMIKTTENAAWALIFFDTLNCVGDSGERLEQFEYIMSRYNEDKFNYDKQINSFFGFSPRSLDDNDDNDENTAATENRRELMRFLKIKEHLRHDILNMPGSRKIYKNYLDIGEFLNDFNKSVSSRIIYSGYKINFTIEYKMFFYSISENDFAVINYILSAFCIRNSVFGAVNACFYAHSNTGILRYEFRQKNGFRAINNKPSDDGYCGNLQKINDFDFIFIIMLLKNNNLKLNVSRDSTDGGTMCIELIFNVNNPQLKLSGLFS